MLPEKTDQTFFFAYEGEKLCEAFPLFPLIYKLKNGRKAVFCLYGLLPRCYTV